MKSTRHRFLLAVIVLAVAVACAIGYFAIDSSNHEGNCDKLKLAAQSDFQGGKLTDAQSKFEAAVKEAEQSKNAMQLPAVLALLAGVYTKLDQNARAEECMVRALRLYEKLEDADNHTVDRATKLLILRKIVQLEIALARVQKKQGHLPQAKLTYQRALKHEKEDPHQIESLALMREYVLILEQLGETELATKTEIEAESNFGTSNDFFHFVEKGTSAIVESDLSKAYKNYRIAYLIAKNHHSQAKSVGAITYMAVCKTLEKKYSEAEKLLREALAIDVSEDPQGSNVTVTALQHLTFVLCLQGKMEEGASTYKKATLINEKLARSAADFVHIRNWYSSHGETRDQVVLYKLIIGWQEAEAKIRPTEEALVLLADEYGAAGRDQECIDTLKRVSKMRGKDANAIDHYTIFQCSTLAQAYTRMGKLKEASRFWRRARELLSAAPQLKFIVSRALAYCIFDMHEPGHEKEIIELLGDEWQAADKNSFDLPMLEFDIKVLLSQYKTIGKPKEKLEILQEAYRIAVPKWNPALINWLAQSIAHEYQLKGDWPKAIDAYKKHIALEQKNGLSSTVMDSQTRLVWCLQMDGRLGEALKLAHFVIATECKKEYWSTRLKAHCVYNLGVIYAKNGRSSVAQKTFEEGRKMCPDVETSLTWASMAAHALSAAKLHEAAEILCLKHIEEAQKSLKKTCLAVPVLMNTLADVYTADKKYQQADIYYKLALKEFASNPAKEARPLEETCKNHYQISLATRKQLVPRD